MRGCLWICVAALCIGCGSNVDLGGGPHQGMDAGKLGTGGSSSGTGGTTGMDAGTAGTTGMDAGTAGTAGTAGMDAGVAGSGGCSATVFAHSAFPTQYWGLALDADNVYWFSFDSTGDQKTWIERKPKAGGQTQQLVSVTDGPESMISSGADLFYAATATGVDHGSVSRVDTSTGKVSPLVENLMAYGVAANSTTVFFTRDLPGGTPAGNELDMVPRGGGQVTTLSSVSLNAAFADPAGPVVANSDVYWIKPGQPSTLETVNPILATPPSTIATGNFIGGVENLALDNGTLFFLEANGAASANGGADLESVSASGGSKKTLAQGTNAGNVIADSGEVYFCCHGTYMPSDPGLYQNDGTIQKVAATGGTPVTMVSGLKGGQGPRVYPIAVDATYLYWIEDDGMNGYSVMRICR